jgi:hypothetical protein
MTTKRSLQASLASARPTFLTSVRLTVRTFRRLVRCMEIHSNTAMAFASLPLRKISRSSTRKTSRLRAVLRMADASRCFQASHLPRSSQPSCTNWRMSFCTVAIAAPRHRAESARPRRKPRRSWFVTPSGSKPVRSQPTTSRSGTETRKR